MGTFFSHGVSDCLASNLIPAHIMPSIEEAKHPEIKALHFQILFWQGLIKGIFLQGFIKGIKKYGEHTPDLTIPIVLCEVFLLGKTRTFECHM